MIRISDEHGPTLARMSPERLIPALPEVIAFSAKSIAADAAGSIDEGGVASPNHIVSAPFDPPNTDTGRLSASVHVGDLIETPASIQTAVIADAPYALYLERGTSRMLPRPFLAPATERGRPDVIEGLVKASREVRRG